MEILTPNQQTMLDEFLRNRTDNSPLVIVSSDDIARTQLLEEICSKHGWQIISSLDLISKIILECSRNNIRQFRKELISRPALVINNLDDFCGREVVQSILEKVLLRSCNPVILAMKSYKGLSYDLRAIIAEGTVISF